MRVLTPFLLVAMLMLGATVASARPDARCDSLGGRTIARDRQVRVFRRHRYDTALIACSYRTRKVRRVYPADGDDGGLCGTPSLLRLAGRMAAVAFDSCGGGDTYYREFIVVRDAISGRTVRRVHSKVDEFVTTPALVVKPDGAIGWIWADCGPIDLPGGDCSYLVEKLDVTGRTWLDSGAIDPHSLTRRGSRMWWTHGPTRRSAKLR